MTSVCNAEPRCPQKTDKNIHNQPIATFRGVAGIDGVSPFTFDPGDPTNISSCNDAFSGRLSANVFWVSAFVAKLSLNDAADTLIAPSSYLKKYVLDRKSVV